MGRNVGKDSHSVLHKTPEYRGPEDLQGCRSSVKQGRRRRAWWCSRVATQEVCGGARVSHSATLTPRPPRPPATTTLLLPPR